MADPLLPASHRRRRRSGCAIDGVPRRICPTRSLQKSMLSSTRLRRLPRRRSREAARGRPCTTTWPAITRCARTAGALLGSRSNATRRQCSGPGWTRADASGVAGRSPDSCDARTAHHVTLAGASCPSINAKRVTTRFGTPPPCAFARRQRRHRDRPLARTRTDLDDQRLSARRHDPQPTSGRACADVGTTAT